MRVSFWVVMIVYSFLSPLHASYEDSLAAAYSSYVKGERAETVAERRESFNESLALYTELESIIPSPDGRLSLNIGNCFFQLEEYGWAIYYYNKGLKLLPRDARIKKNLEIARQKAGLKAEDEQAFFSLLMSSNEKWILFKFCFSILVFLMSFLIWRRSKLVRRIAFGFGGLIAILGLILGYSHTFPRVEGVFVRPAKLHRDAGEQYALVKGELLFQGEKVQIMDVMPDGKWLKISTSDGTMGFVPHSAIRIM